jgi:AbrB family looped-hinge helix DNA binding protein
MKSDPMGRKFLGSVLVGQRGQVVIPEEARKRYDIQAGDRLLVMGGRSGVLVFIKAESIKKFYENLMKKVSEIRKQ